MTLPNPHFENSYARVFGHGIGMNENADVFFARFYEHFLATPEVAEMFADTDLPQQQLMLKKSVLHLVTYYAAGTLTPDLQRLAERHQQLEVAPELLDVWMRALLATLREFDSEVCEVTELAWCWAMAPGLAYMRQVMSQRPPG
jgi:hemoglobin-like flavoprotein